MASQDDRVANHPWLTQATGFMERIDAMKGAGHALELLYCLRFLDAAHEAEPDAGAQLERLGSFLPADGFLRVRAVSKKSSSGRSTSLPIRIGPYALCSPRK